jgi:hypothetical protein
MAWQAAVLYARDAYSTALASWSNPVRDLAPGPHDAAHGRQTFEDSLLQERACSLDLRCRSPQRRLGLEPAVQHLGDQVVEPIRERLASLRAAPFIEPRPTPIPGLKASVRA